MLFIPLPLLLSSSSLLLLLLHKAVQPKTHKITIKLKQKYVQGVFLLTGEAVSLKMFEKYTEKLQIKPHATAIKPK